MLEVEKLPQRAQAHPVVGDIDHGVGAGGAGLLHQVEKMPDPAAQVVRLVGIAGMDHGDQPVLPLQRQVRHALVAGPVEDGLGLLQCSRTVHVEMGVENPPAPGDLPAKFDEVWCSVGHVMGSPVKGFTLMLLP